MDKITTIDTYLTTVGILVDLMNDSKKRKIIFKHKGEKWKLIKLQYKGFIRKK